MATLHAENDELWDLYPSAIAFGQFDSADEIVAVDIIGWPDYAAGESALGGQQLDLVVTDAAAGIQWTPADSGPVSVQVTVDWSWTPLFEDSFVTAGCTFRFEQALGARALEGAEGYRLAQREVLAWEGAEGVCPERVSKYFENLADNPIMPAHLGDWQSVSGPSNPTDVGRFEMQIWHDLRRSRRLLPFPAAADAGADPVEALLGAVAPPAGRFALIVERLGPLVYKDGMEP